MSHMIGTSMYNAPTTHEFTKANGMAMIYITKDILPLKSLPMAVDGSESLPWTVMRTRTSIKEAIAVLRSTTP